MKLSKKVFLYTFLTSLLIGTMIIAYFGLMLPGLYADYKQKQFFEQIEQMHTQNSAGKQCDIAVNDTFYALSMKVNKNDYKLSVCNQYLSAEFELKDQTLKNLHDTLIQNLESDNQKVWESIDFSTLKSVFVLPDDLITVTHFKAQDNPFDLEPHSSHAFKTNEGSFVYQTGVKDAYNDYTNYVMVKEKEHQIYLTFASTMTPSLTELSPLILESMPMIIMVVTLLSILSAHYFSKQLAQPIETLAQQALLRKTDKDLIFKQSHQNDEFKTLENALNDLNQSLQESMTLLEKQNQKLADEKEKQTLFMMNTTHQLKTPLVSSLLLLDGMIQEVSQFKDVRAHLPKVKSELLQLSQALETLLHTFKEKERPLNKENFDLSTLIGNNLLNLKIKSDEKQVKIKTDLEPVFLYTDVFIMNAIVENILINAVNYTERNAQIIISLSESKLQVYNETEAIDPEILSKIHEPFMRLSTSKEKGSGLGLYLVDTFSKMLGMRWKIENERKGIMFTLYFTKEH